MTNSFKAFVFFCLLCSNTFAQTATTSADSSSSFSAAPAPAPTGFIFKPTIGLGTGMFSFYGDLYNKNFQAPMVSRIGYDLNVSQRFTDYLQLNFYVLFGKLGANERFVGDANRNLNFESEIRVGGVNLLYNFGNFLPAKRSASPYISLGIESFEFLSKTDMLDKNGKQYHYWSNGGIYDLPENDPLAAFANELHRDYTYETDIRESNLDGFGKYPERSWAIPVGVGAIMKINDYWDFKLGTTMHFSFTDYIDGVSDESVQGRTGNGRNDNFMMTSFSLHYNLGIKKKGASEEMQESDFKDVDFFALDLEDSDKDGITDATDSCQGTPEGVPVDAKGCPIDEDGDGVPNFKDDELNTPKDAFVDEKGVQLSDSLIAYRYNYYMDSTGAFNETVYYDHSGRAGSSIAQKEYMVDLGTFKKGLPPDLMSKFLSIPDISSSNLDDSTTMYTAGKFNNLLDAEKRKQQLVNEGLADAKVVYKQNGKFYPAPAFNASANTGNVANNNTSGNNSGTTNNNAATNNSGNNSGTPENNTNSGNTNNNAANNTGNTATNSNNTNNNTNTNNTNTNNTNNTATNNTATNNAGNTSSASSAVPPQGVILRVQLGAYTRKLSKAVFKDIDDLIEIRTEDGLYKYMTGSFTTFDQAAKHKVEMLLKGYQGAFITAYKDGKRVALEKAGATPAKKEDQLDQSDSTAVNAFDKKLVSFKVQVGVFKNEPPSDKQEIFAKLKNVSKESTSAGLIRYVVGNYSSYSAAQAAKADLSKTPGLEDAFVVAFYNGQYISIQEAQELLK